MRTTPRPRTRFACAACGAVFAKWEGRCGICGEWNSLVEETERAAPPQRITGDAAGVPVLVPLLADEDLTLRTPTGIGEVDRVLDGGMVRGALVLLGGDPGIGKSTLALQVARQLGTSARPALYCAGEESAAQLGLRARRLGCAGPEVSVLAATDLDVILDAIEAQRPPLAVVDSVQTVVDATVAGGPGSVSQVREAVGRLLAAAKRSEVSILLVGHVTKEGAIAGPRTLEHLVDVVLFLEGDRHGEHRVLRGIKNRFGAAGEVGIFAMSGEGLRAVDAPGRAFVDDASLGSPGSVLTVTCEGSRPLAVEVQALSVPSQGGIARRNASGFDLARLHVLLAVLEKRAKVRLGSLDVYVNAVGGVRLSEPAVDLAVAMAVAGVRADRAVRAGWVVLGELGLAGEVRRVARLGRRLAEAAALGATDAIVPTARPEQQAGAGSGDAAARLRVVETAGLRLHPVATVVEALALLV